MAERSIKCHPSYTNYRSNSSKDDDSDNDNNDNTTITIDSSDSEEPSRTSDEKENSETEEDEDATSCIISSPQNISLPTSSFVSAKSNLGSPSFSTSPPSAASQTPPSSPNQTPPTSPSLLSAVPIRSSPPSTSSPASTPPRSPPSPPPSSPPPSPPPSSPPSSPPTSPPFFSLPSSSLSTTDPTNSTQYDSDDSTSSDHDSNKENEREEKEEEEEVKEKEKEKPPQFEVAFQFRKLVKQLYQQEVLMERFARNLPDGGANIKNNIADIKKRMIHLRGYIPSRQQMIELLQQQNQEEERHEGIMKKSQFEPQKGISVHSSAKLLTHGTVADLHSALATRPTEDMLAEDPPELKVPLMTHQKSGLKFLQWREKQIPRGGILADEMGLGKTLAMISLILTSNRERKATQTETFRSSDRSPDCPYTSHGTLVVAPLTLLNIWEEEIESKVYRHNLSVFKYHGAKRPRDSRELLHYDVIITTYNLIGMEGEGIKYGSEGPPDTANKKRVASPTLLRIHWNRVILDEAHTIRNPKSGISAGCCQLSANYRWAITGTPIQNKLRDFYSLIKFLRLAPFNDQRVWKDTIEGKGLGMKRLQTMVSGLVLRREKNELEFFKLPDKNVVCHKLHLTDGERHVYNVLFHFSRSFFMKYLHELGQDVDMLNETGPSIDDLLSQVPSHLFEAVQTIMLSMIPQDALDGKPSGTIILVLLLRLRQCCNHFHLLSTALTSDEATDELTDAMASLSLNQLDQASSTFPEEFEKRHMSSKVKAIVDAIKEIVSSDVPGALPNKCIIVSQWTTMLRVIECHLISEDISYTRIDGKVSVKDRQENIKSFNSSSRNPRVMLLSLQAGGVGLTLTAANHLFIVDLHWNPQLEQQASDRCHRVGQTREVMIHRFMVENTVESVIALIQDKKLKLAADVLHGTSTKSKKDSAKLTIDDLKLLFEM